MSYFQLKTPRDMLDKSCREYGRLTADFNIENVFNFFVTAYHIQDYIMMAGSVPPAVLKTFLNDPDLKAARDMCNKGKHMTLTQGSDPVTNRRNMGPLNTHPLNTLPINGIRVVWTIYTGNRSFDVARLAQSVMTKWDAFFAANGL
jgi:hypothetical protein